MSETSKSGKKSKDCEKSINFTVHCNGSDIGNGVGIGNGNFNSGGEGCSGFTGFTGFTGNTGSDDLVCDSRCNAVCEQVILDVVASPRSVSRIGQEISWTYTATNVSGRKISRPLVISSSYLQTRLLSDHGMDSGETISVTIVSYVREEDLRLPRITNVSFVAYGVSTGIPDRFLPGERVSPIKTIRVATIIPDLNVSGSVVVSPTLIRLNLVLKNEGPLNINRFIFEFGDLFQNEDPVVIVNPDDSFETVGNSLLRLVEGKIIASQTGYSVVVEAVRFGAHDINFIFQYSYGSEGGALITRTVILPNKENI